MRPRSLALAAFILHLLLASSSRAEDPRTWLERGSWFNWRSTLPENRGREVRIFYITAGDPAAPAIYFNHGWPTSSWDFADLFDDLARDHFVCALDTPGYGFSERPLDGFVYSIFDDARLVEHFLVDVLHRTRFSILTHDKGDSVGLEFLRRYVDRRERGIDPGYVLEHHFLLNGSIVLEEADISELQQALLSPATGEAVARALDGRSLAFALGSSVYSPRLDAAERRDLAWALDRGTGTDVLYLTIQYLYERAVFEDEWMDALARSDVPATLIWGERDPIALPGVADATWEAALADRPAAASYWRAPMGNHYVQHDLPSDVAGIVRRELHGTPFRPAAAGTDQTTYLHLENPAHAD